MSSRSEISKVMFNYERYVLPCCSDALGRDMI